MQLQRTRLVLQLLLLSSALVKARETIGGDAAEELARPYLNLMKQRQANRVEEVRYKRNAAMEKEKAWEKKGMEWGSLMSEELGVVRQFPNWWPWGTRSTRQGMEANLARGTVHQEL